MALAKTVTKMQPKGSEGGNFAVGIHLIITDDNRPDLGSGVQTVIDQDVSVNAAITDDVEEKANEVTIKAQAIIDLYKKERQIYNSNKYENARTLIDNAIVL